MSFNPKTIAREWSHKISSGIPDLKNKWHLDKLEELLKQKGYSTYFINVGSCGMPRDDGRYGSVALFNPNNGYSTNFYLFIISFMLYLEFIN